MVNILKSMKRCKTAKSDLVTSEDQKLRKCLNLTDLIGLGVGSTLGVGIYLLAGRVAKNIAGPAVILSFFLAAIASGFAGLCYAEFGSRTPTAGSAYTYCYLTLGEFVAFTMGWNLITEYVIGAASVAKALSVYVDSFFGHFLENLFRNLYETNMTFFSEYFDFLALFFCIIFSVALATGLKESVWLNNLVTGTNLLVVLFVTIAGSFFINTENWSLPKTEIPEGNGIGGFFPYGWEGVFKGAGACFYGFIGFDCIATTGEEVANAQKLLPLAIVISLLIICFLYFGISVVVTLMLPYYLQDEVSPLSYAFESNNCHWAKWLINIGALFGLYASFFGAFYPISRIIYTMAKDGLIYQYFGKVNQKYKTPFVGTIASGIITGLIAAVFDVDHLINLNAVGTLLSYTMVAACVIILRYTDTANTESDTENRKLLNSRESAESSSSLSIFSQLFSRRDSIYTSSNFSSKIVIAQVLLFCILSFIFAVSSMYSCPFKIPLMVVLLGLMLIQLIYIKIIPESDTVLPFKMPLVPFLPAFSMLLNIYLMITFDCYTWIRFLIWLAIGFIVYFTYGISNSIERHAENRK